ncbi:MAG: hypothetical protein HKN79_00650 [Flavobacteriales bacterium]|nr:hypothetical protein [Flavobacteriales bacterium]
MNTGLKLTFTMALLVIVTLSTQAQQAMWRDQALRPCKKKDAQLYVKTTPADQAYRLEMFDLEGRLKMIGKATDERGERFQGYFEFYHDNGKLESKGHYLNNHKIGIWERFDSRGNRLAERMYAAFNPVKQAFFYVDKMPEYEAGTENFLDFLKLKLKPLVEDGGSAQKGETIEIGFVVSEQGRIEDIEMVKGLNDEWDEKALNVLQALPKWVPGRNSGEKVRVWIQLAVTL